MRADAWQGGALARWTDEASPGDDQCMVRVKGIELFCAEQDLLDLYDVLHFLFGERPPRGVA